MKKYNPKQIEPKWQKVWADTKLYAAKDFDESRPKYVMLTEFPYPSGEGLHMGHIREYTLGDILARYKRMHGHNVLYPMGYDSFGLPTENYAIKNKIAPQQATEQNIAIFQKQFESLGYSIDWDRSFSTADPDYYKWTQWLFLQFFKAGLAYQDEVAINWCPHCKTGLANEEVVNGRHERCGTLVEKKRLKQWMFKITDYADRLIEGLKDVDYPSRIADQQVNWIGRSLGVEVDFDLRGITDQPEGKHKATVFTTRVDTLGGATFLVISPELAQDWLDIGWKAPAKVTEYIKKSLRESEIERMDESKAKTGVDTGIQAVNPLTKQEIPVWVADYVLGGYGTGAIMAVPAHDQRDFEFASKFELPIVQVVEGGELPYAGEGELVNSGKYTGLKSSHAREVMAQDLGRERVNYRLRDWIFSRQHYWGEPIPIIHCPEHGAVPVPDDQLPVELPKVKNYEPTDTGESPLAAIDDWVNTTCPICGKPAKRETDTMPNWAGSSWYYLRFFDAHNDTAFADPKKLQYWGAVDMYLGGMEHTTLHLLYSRFWHQFLYDQGLVPTPEPYAARRGQGIILAEDGSKMSKTKGNVSNPSSIIDQGYGADALRLAITFLAPYDQTTPWNSNGVDGTKRFLNRVWALVHEHLGAGKHGEDTGTDQALETALTAATHKAVRKVTTDLEHFGFNTAIAGMMELVNEMYKLKTKLPLGSESWKSNIELLLQVLAPFAPHLAEELWQDLGYQESIHVSGWPSWDPELVKDELVTIVVQMNGKLRAQLELPTDSSEKEVVAAAEAHEAYQRSLDGKKVIKTIYVPNKLVNFVTKPQ